MRLIWNLNYVNSVVYLGEHWAMVPFGPENVLQAFSSDVQVTKQLVNI